MKLFLIVLLPLIFVTCTKVDVKITPETSDKKIFVIEKRQIVFSKHAYQIKNLEQERK